MISQFESHTQLIDKAMAHERNWLPTLNDEEEMVPAEERRGSHARRRGPYRENCSIFSSHQQWAKVYFSITIAKAAKPYT